ncbi:MAG TPA: hypothetical protein H9797_05985, partial [Candidatus Gallimonas gallistercoris]|nr:hypothetical protein [Candidatus Gallimonas gallistercoris]
RKTRLAATKKRVRTVPLQYNMITHRGKAVYQILPLFCMILPVSRHAFRVFFRAFRASAE